MGRRASAWKPGVCCKCGMVRSVSTKQERCYSCTQIVSHLKPPKLASYDTIRRTAPKGYADRKYHGRTDL